MAENLGRIHVADQPHILNMLDQHACDKYMDIAENHGLPGDTCSYPRRAAGVFLADHSPITNTCLISSNLPCEGGFGSYGIIEEKIGLPTYRLDIPYNFKDEKAIATFVEDMKGMIVFSWLTTGSEQSAGWINKNEGMEEACSKH